jgi:hypothetical protein
VLRATSQSYGDVGVIVNGDHPSLVVARPARVHSIAGPGWLRGAGNSSWMRFRLAKPSEGAPRKLGPDF